MAISPAHRIRLEERRQRALELRKRGLSFRAIAAALQPEFGQSYGPSLAYKDVRDGLNAIANLSAEQAATIRQLELERCDQWLLSLAPLIQQADTKAIATAIQISDRRCKLLGLGAALKLQVEAAIEQELRLMLTALESKLPDTVFKQVLDCLTSTK